VQTLFVHAARIVFKVLYALFCLRPRQNIVLFLSRQTNVPSYDFKVLGDVYQERGYKPVYQVKKLSKRTVPSYAVHVIKEIYYLARCQLCFLDRYDPVVCLLDFECEPVVNKQEGLHFEFPQVPKIVQLWHAFGAYKSFGYQSKDTSEGLSSKSLKAFKVHRNYSWIVCTGESARVAFAEAFAYPLERVLNLGRPEYQLLANPEAPPQKSNADAPTILFAPTLRYAKNVAHPFHVLHDQHHELFETLPARLVWAFHPLENGTDATGVQHQMLSQADYIVTDYSSVVYEAFLLKKKVLFFVPDIEAFKISPGLNIDPEQVAPEIIAKQSSELYGMLASFVAGESAYPQGALDSFVGDTFAAEPTLGSLLDFVPKLR
jgi:hypothetical protein